MTLVKNSVLYLFIYLYQRVLSSVFVHASAFLIKKKDLKSKYLHMYSLLVPAKFWPINLKCFPMKRWITLYVYLE